MTSDGGERGPVVQQWVSSRLRRIQYTRLRRYWIPFNGFPRYWFSTLAFPRYWIQYLGWRLAWSLSIVIVLMIYRWYWFSTLCFLYIFSAFWIQHLAVFLIYWISTLVFSIYWIQYLGWCRRGDSASWLHRRCIDDTDSVPCVLYGFVYVFDSVPWFSLKILIQYLGFAPRYWFSTLPRPQGTDSVPCVGPGVLIPSWFCVYFRFSSLIVV